MSQVSKTSKKTIIRAARIPFTESFEEFYTPEKKFSFLRDFDIFKGIKDAQLKKIIGKTKYKKYKTNDNISEPNSYGNILYFLLEGEVAVLINGREIARRKAKDVFGEMSLLNFTPRRFVTLKATKPSVFIEIDIAKLLTFMKNNPLIYKNIASKIGDRLRETYETIRKPNKKPVIFIGSSNKYKKTVEKFGNKLKKYIIHPWTNYIKPSNMTLEALISQSKTCDFAIFVFGEDDDIIIGKKSQKITRDNVILEFGLFMGSIGRERTFLFRTVDKIKLPSDLKGFTYLDENIDDAVKQIEEMINKLGVK